MTQRCEVLIIGTGIAGCSAALRLAQAGVPVLMITRAQRPEDTASAWAQGGIVYRAPTEGPHLLVEDLMASGCGINNRDAVALLASEGPEWIERILMQTLKVPFNRDADGDLSLTEEAAHSMARILHHDDTSGLSIERAFLRELSVHPRVTLLTEHTAVDLLTLSHHSDDPQDMYKRPRCVGAYVLDQKTGEVKTVLAKETILATGGIGQIYLHTTNPPGARGDGVAMAYRTGARVMHLEYVQFHPTALYQKSGERFLISETLRGEGACLLNHRGEPFMKRIDPRGDLAPRDIVARAMHEEMLREGVPHLYLDISTKPASWIRQRFPSIYQTCMAAGIDMTTAPIPVVPAAHYACGGVSVDLEGRSTLENLRVVGEASCTGLHGANRLASTSLLEDLVWGCRAGDGAARDLNEHTYALPSVRDWESKQDVADPDLIVQDWQSIRQTMWNYVGLVRTHKRLERAQRILGELSDEIRKFYKDCRPTDELLGLRNGIRVARMVLYAAQRNPRSIGCHFIKPDRRL